MRYNTFRSFLGVGLGVVVLTFCGGSVWLMRSWNTAAPQPQPPIAAATPLTATAPQSSAPQPIVSRPAVTASSQVDDPRRDKLIVDYLNTHAQAIGDKAKDVLPRETFKVNLYADNGSPTWNRLKVDYNRNEKWDEKWNLTDGQPVKRHVASRDDEVYNLEFRWQGGRWVAK